MATMEINKGHRWVTCGLGCRTGDGETATYFIKVSIAGAKGTGQGWNVHGRDLVSSLLPAAWVLGSGTRAWAVLTLSLGTLEMRGRLGELPLTFPGTPASSLGMGRSLGTVLRQRMRLLTQNLIWGLLPVPSCIQVRRGH